ncbi:uncharacterized protein PG998_002666 [Apiospora kogelbergensis]|uniref:uncharacterized protein n=1 Tax=Apiospora kogelbergensis TaxID=1337665 RepID=UPI00312FF4E1
MSPPRRLHHPQQNPLPPRLTKPAALAALHNHDQFLSADPHLTSYKRLSAPGEVSGDYASYQVPASIVPIAAADGDQVKVYEVHDHVPNPVWSSDVTSVEEFVDCADGVWVRVRSPLGIVLETTWNKNGTAEEEEEEATLELVQTCECRCNRLLASICKGQIEKGWREVHQKLIQGMLGDGSGGDKDGKTAGGGAAAAAVAAPTATVAA